MGIIAPQRNHEADANRAAEKRLEILNNILGYLKRNAFGQPSGAWIGRKSGQEQPGIYGVPENEVLESQVSGRGSLSKVLKVLAKNPEIITKHDIPPMLKYHPETRVKVAKQAAKDAGTELKVREKFEGFGPLEDRKSEFILHIRKKYPHKTLEEAFDIANHFYGNELLGIPREGAEYVRAHLAKKAK